FLEIISVDFDSEDIEDDIITLLWEKDFQHIRYTVDETSLLEDEEYLEKATKEAKEGTMEEDNISSAYHEAIGEEDVEELPPVQIGEDDLKALASEIQNFSRDKIPKLTDILFDMLYLAETFEEFKDITRIISNSVEYSVRHGNVKGAYQILRRTQELLDKSGNPDLKKHLGMVFTQAGSPPLIKALGELLDSKEGIDENLFANYTSLLSVNAIPSFISLLGELESISGRKNTINSLSILGKKDLTTLLKGLRDSRWFVVRNIIHVLRRIGDRRALDPLIKAVEHPDKRVRKEVIKTLGEFGGENAVMTIQPFIDDPDKNIRITAARAMSVTGSEYAKVAIIEKLSERKTQNADFEEIKELFEILTRWNDEDVLNFILGIVSKNPFLGRSRYNTYKAGAAYALGLLGKPEVADVLDKLRSTKHQLLSEHSYAALKRIKYGRK
ncbi:MAG: HEAT repeat domain-containing protein, partial [Desulfobacterales bacterium]|nr:HEAT repeat domain-containing protein [Desulfobacterales bacterium]